MCIECFSRGRSIEVLEEGFDNVKILNVSRNILEKAVDVFDRALRDYQLFTCAF